MEYLLVSTKLDTFCYLTCKLHRAICSRFDTIPACDGRTDAQTDGIAVASTALAMRRAVKTGVCVTQRGVFRPPITSTVSSR